MRRALKRLVSYCSYSFSSMSYVFLHYRAETADLNILIADSSVLSSQSIVKHLDNTMITPADLAEMFLCPHIVPGANKMFSSEDTLFSSEDTLVVLNKTDLLSEDTQQWQVDPSVGGSRLKVCWLSCKTGQGVEKFMQEMRCILERMQVYANMPVFHIPLFITLDVETPWLGIPASLRHDIVSS